MDESLRFVWWFNFDPQPDYKSMANERLRSACSMDLPKPQIGKLQRGPWITANGKLKGSLPVALSQGSRESRHSYPEKFALGMSIELVLHG